MPGVCTHMNIRMFIHMNIHVYLSIFVSILLSVCIHTHEYIYLYLFIYPSIYLYKRGGTAASPKRQLGMPGVSSVCAICRAALEPFAPEVGTLEPFWRFRERFTEKMFVGSAPAFVFAVYG